MTAGLVVGCIAIIFVVARAAWNHYKKKKKKKKTYNAQHFDISEEVAAVSLAPQVVESSSIRGWLDMKVKSGYSNKFSNAFEEAGIEDIGDLAKVDKKVMTQLKEHLVVAGAKAMHLKNIQEAIDEVRTPGAADAVKDPSKLHKVHVTTILAQDIDFTKVSNFEQSPYAITFRRWKRGDMKFVSKSEHKDWIPVNV